jgi:hypothetical protein
MGRFDCKIKNHICCKILRGRTKQKKQNKKATKKPPKIKKM